MTHPADTTRIDKAQELKEKLAAMRGGNGQSAPALPAAATPKKRIERAVEVEEAPVVRKAKAPKAKKEAKVVKELKETKQPKVVRKAKVSEPKEKKTVERHRTMDRDKEGDGLRPIERDIAKVVKARKGKPISLKDIAIAIFGEAKVREADENRVKDNKIVREVRNGVRQLHKYGIIKRWKDTGDKDAKNGFVVIGSGTPPAGAATKARKAAKAKVEKQPKKGVKRTAKK